MLCFIATWTLPDRPELQQLLLYQIVGLAVVLVALTLLWTVISAVGVFFRAAEKKGNFSPEKPLRRIPEEVHTVTPEVLVVLSAAVYTVMGDRWAITSAHEMLPEFGQDDIKRMAWSVEGRRQIFSSHHLR